MKLIWHIVKKDLRRFWIGLLVLTGLTILKYCLAGGIPHLDPSGDGTGRLLIYQGFLLAIQLVLTFFLAAAIVQEDSVPAPGALWKTLPLTRPQLLGAKVLSIFLICILPVALTLSVGWIFLGLPVGQLGWPLFVFGGTQLGLSLLALAFGSLTQNSSQLLFWMIGVALGFAIPSIVAEPLLHQHALVTAGTRFTHLFLLNCVWITSSLAVILAQYLGHSRRRSIAFVGAGVLLSFYFIAAENTRFSMDLSPLYLSAQRELDGKIASLGVKIAQAEVALPKPEVGWKPDMDSKLASSLLHVVVEAERGLIITPYRYYSAWPQSNLYGRPLADTIYPERYDFFRRDIERVLNFPPGPTSNQLSFGAESQINVLDRQIWDGSPKLYRGQIDLIVNEISLVGQLPLVKGASFHTPIGSATILGVGASGSFIHMDLEERYSAVTPDPGWFSGLDALFNHTSRWYPRLVNLKTKAVLTPGQISSPAFPSITSYVYGAFLTHVRLGYTLPESDAGALADWVLVEVRIGESYRSLRTFETNVSLHEVPEIIHDRAWAR